MAALPFARRPEAESMAGSVCTDTEIVGRPKLVEKMQKCSLVYRCVQYFDLTRLQNSENVTQACRCFSDADFLFKNGIKSSKCYYIIVKTQE